MMKCEEVESAMIDYLDMTLEKEHRDEIEKHLETCESCLDELQDFQRILKDVESAEVVQPDETLRINFYHMLHAEMNKQAVAEARPVIGSPARSISPFVMRIAAGAALLIAGTFIGIFINRNLNKVESNSQMALLRTEVQSMKELMMFTMLKEESPSQRIKAVNFSDEIQAPDDKVLEALIKTLNQDKNVNVRLAAAYSLAKFAERKPVRDSLVASLAAQTEPILQVVLMNILVENKEKDAIKPMQRIIEDDKTLKEVKNVAQKGIQILM
jgi:hypothetical protein